MWAWCTAFRCFTYCSHMALSTARREESSQVFQDMRNVSVEVKTLADNACWASISYIIDKISCKRYHLV